MSGDIVETQACWKSKTSNQRIAGLKSLVAAQCTNTSVDFFGNGGHLNAGLDDVLLNVVTDLAMDLGGLTVVGQEVVVPCTGVVANFFLSCTAEVLIWDQLAYGILSARK